jgi:competence protein ComGC
MASGFEGQYLRDMSYARTDPDWAIGSDFVASRPVDLKALELVPADVVDATLTSLDMAGLYHQTLRTTEKLCQRIDAGALAKEESGATSHPATSPADRSPGWLERQLTQRLHGFDVEQEVLKYFGSQVIYFQAREFSGASLNLVLELKEPVAFERRVAESLKKLPPPFHFKEHSAGNYKYRVLDLSEMGPTAGMMGITPCYAIADKWLLVSTSTAGTARFLRALGSRDSKSLAEREEMKKFLAEHQGEKLTSISISDEAASLQMIYPSVAMFLPMLSKMLVEKLPEMVPVPAPVNEKGKPRPLIEFAPVPDFDVLNRHMLVNVNYTALDGDLRVTHSRNGASITSKLALVAGTSLGLSITLPSLARARELAKRTVCAQNLSKIGKAMYIYANKHDDKFPPSLRTLVESGALTADDLICPSSEDKPEKGSGSSYIYIGGQAGAAPGRNVIAYEKDNHEGEGGHVLFADSHVDFITPYSKVEQLVRETKARLKN